MHVLNKKHIMGIFSLGMVFGAVSNMALQEDPSFIGNKLIGVQEPDLAEGVNPTPEDKCLATAAFALSQSKPEKHNIKVLYNDLVSIDVRTAQNMIDTLGQTNWYNLRSPTLSEECRTEVISRVARAAASAVYQHTYSD